MNGAPGFYVVTPLRLAGTGAVVLVQRGWIQRDFQRRERLPPVRTPPGEVEVRGRLAPPPAKLYAFDAEEKGPIRQNLDLTRFRTETGLPLLPVSVQQAGPASEGLLRQWPQAGSGAEKNYGYAFQWWALAALISRLYVWFQLVIPRRRQARSV
jgi:surfeit locus 1 family protein